MTNNLSGQGKVFKGQQFIADVHYELQITSQYRDTRTHTSEGQLMVGQDVRVRISPASALSGCGVDRLTLHMKDGRKQEFFPSSDGNCIGSGGPHD